MSVVAWPGSRASAAGLSLPDLIDLATRRNPGVAASADATRAIEAQLLEARRSWMPSGELTTILGPSPDIKCQNDETPPLNLSGGDLKRWREDRCYRTSIAEQTLKFNGIFTRTDVRLVQPVYTFGKISTGVDAAEKGVEASRSREAGVVAEVELNVRKAYHAVKLSREILETLREGLGYIAEAEKKIEQGLKDGDGDFTPSDRYRVATYRAEIEAKIIAAGNGTDVARAGLRALVGPDAPSDLDVDPEPLTELRVPTRPLAHYEEQARWSRPEVRALDHLLASKRALAEFEKRKLYPDLVLVGSATFAYASSVDNPQNVFAADPFNTASIALGAAMRVPLDVGVRQARTQGAVAQANEMAQRRREALGGIVFEVARAHADLVAATARSQAYERGKKATQRWIAAVMQGFSVGTAEARELTDALAPFFLSRINHLTAMFDVNMAAASLSRAVGVDVTR